MGERSRDRQVALVLYSEQLLDLAQFELERGRLDVSAVRLGPAPDPWETLRCLLPPPRLCVYELSDTEGRGEEFETVARYLPDVRFVLLSATPWSVPDAPRQRADAICARVLNLEATVREIVRCVRHDLGPAFTPAALPPGLRERCANALDVAAARRGRSANAGSNTGEHLRPERDGLPLFDRAVLACEAARLTTQTSRAIRAESRGLYGGYSVPRAGDVRKPVLRFVVR